MRLLILGGTRFLGRAIVDEAVSRGYDVTTFSRGHSGHPGRGVETIHGDRTQLADLEKLTQRDWDGVIDTSVLAPVHVAASARLLAERAAHYTYVSTISVYADYPGRPVTEDSPALPCPPDAEGTEETLGYGPLKAGSERAVQAAVSGRALIARPGVIVGPHEEAGRLTWWLARLARGGQVLAPGRPDRPVRATDARDLAAWLIDNTRRGIPGVVNVPGPAGVTMGDLISACDAATRADRAGDAEPRWVPDETLLAAGVQPWSEIPLWAPDTPDLAGAWRVSGDRALRIGMRYRPLADTAHGTWAWQRQLPDPAAPPHAPDRPAPGLGADREREILASV